MVSARPAGTGKASFDLLISVTCELIIKGGS